MCHAASSNKPKDAPTLANVNRGTKIKEQIISEAFFEFVSETTNSRCCALTSLIAFPGSKDAVWSNAV